MCLWPNTCQSNDSLISLRRTFWLIFNLTTSPWCITLRLHICVSSPSFVPRLICVPWIYDVWSNCLWCHIPMTQISLQIVFWISWTCLTNCSRMLLKKQYVSVFVYSLWKIWVFLFFYSLNLSRNFLADLKLYFVIKS